jgi:hypothetical protein
MPWNPPIDIVGDPHPLRVGASDVASTAACGRFLALKVRPQVKRVDGWARLWADGQGTPFPLGDLVQLVVEAHRLPDSTDYSAQRAWLQQRMDQRGIHRLVRPYLEHSVEQILDAHDAIEAEIGALSLLTVNPSVGASDRTLGAWAPLYETSEGVREIRRIRVGSAHDAPDDADRRWAATAGYVAATFPARTASGRVRVVEIGAVDGSYTLLFEGTAVEAAAAFMAGPRQRAIELTEQDHVVPCSSCGDCKAAGSCRGVLAVDGMLGQGSRGLKSRSISATALTQYVQCPARWLLDSELHLPKDRTSSEGMVRGGHVHRWLEVAHSRGHGCTSADLPAPGDGLGLAEGVLVPDDYVIAHPFLLQHVEHCPLATDDVVLLAVEQTVYGYDHDAEVVPVARPDLMYMVGDRLVVRETKTAQGPYPGGRDDAYNKHLQIPFMLTLLASGLNGRHGARTGSVELELLTASESFLWNWDLDDAAVAAVATGDIRRAVEDWHVDDRWETRIGPHCSWCPVRRWCPDGESWQMRAEESFATGGSHEPVDDDLPPF